MISPVKELKKNEARLYLRIARSWKPRERVSIPEFVEKNVRFPAEFGQPGHYKFDGYEFWREPFEAAEDPETDEISVMSGTQIGKTEWLQGLMVALSTMVPAPQMFVGPDQDYVHENRDKVYAHALINPAVQKMIPDKQKWNMRHIDLGRSLCYLAWSGNPQRVSGKACKFVFCSEVDRFKQPVREGAIASLIKERVKAWYNYLIVWEGTPTDQNSHIADLYEGSDQRRYHVPCPECGHYQEFRFFCHKTGPYKGKGGIGNLKTADGKWRDKEEVLKSAYYICEKGCRVDNEEKRWMVANGVWCPRGQTVNRKGKLTKKPLRGPRLRGYQMSSILSPKITFGRVAYEYLDSIGSEKKLRNFWNNWLGFKYSGNSKTPQWKVLGARQTGGYHRGTVPPAAFFLVAGVDVQEDRCYWLVRAFGEGKTSWLVDWGLHRVRLSEKGRPIRNSDLKQLKESVIERNFPLVDPNPLGLRTMKPHLICVDVNYASHRVWDWARKWPGDHVRCVAGDHQMKAQFFQKTIVEKTVRDGKPYEGGMERWGVNTKHYKKDMHDRWRYPLDEPGAFWLPLNIVQDGETYLKHITCESLVTTDNGGVPSEAFVKMQGTENHWGDTEVYASAGADMVVGFEWEGLQEQFAIEVEPQYEPDPHYEDPEVNFSPR